MKKLVLSLIVILSLLLANHVSYSNNNTSNQKEVGNFGKFLRGPVLNIKIEFGKPKAGCTGFGVCRIGFDLGSAMQPTGTITLTEGHLVLSVDKNSLSRSQVETYFSSRTFIVDEDYALTSDVCRSLGTDSYTIKVGK
ncbi:MAG: hypothetical protein KDD49_12250, partial [Bacteroidetes bacterium]|nr:hypothetical protein [Bacteroidota bacterium]